jgi:hypothetical protein
VKITLTIDTDTRAFERSVQEETARILTVLANRIKRTDLSQPFDRMHTLRDSNGQTVGQFRATDEKNAGGWRSL